MVKYNHGRSIRTLTNDEILKLFQFIDNQARSLKERRRAACWQLIIALMVDAGVRVGECMAIEVNQLWFCNRPAQLLHLKAEQTKSKVERTIPITKRIEELIWQIHLLVWVPFEVPPHAKALCYKLPWEPVPIRTVQHTIKQFGINGLGFDIHPHMLRHTFATRLMKVTDMRTVQELLGHANLASTQVYTHPSTENMIQAIEAMSD